MLASRKLDGDLRRGDRGRLRGAAHQVHLDPLFVAVPRRAVSEGVEIERAAKFAVDPDEQVLVECGGHAERIIVGELQLALGLDEIRAEQQQIAGPQRRRGYAAGTTAPPARSKLPMFDPRRSTSIGRCPRGRRAAPAQTDFVGRSGGRRPTRAAAGVSALLGLFERLRRDINRWTRAEPPARCSASAEHGKLFAAAASELDDRGRFGVERRHDFLRVRDRAADARRG